MESDDMNTISMNAEARRAALEARITPRKHPSRACALPLPSWRDAGGEKILRGLLVLAAAVGIGYGFLCVVDLVQSCALFGAGVGRLIQ